MTHVTDEELDEILGKLRVQTVKRNNAFVHIIQREREAKTAITQLLLEAEKDGLEKGLKLERGRHVVAEGQLNQELNEIKNALKVLAEWCQQ